MNFLSLFVFISFLRQEHTATFIKTSLSYDISNCLIYLAPPSLLNINNSFLYHYARIYHHIIRPPSSTALAFYCRCDLTSVWYSENILRWSHMDSEWKTHIHTDCFFQNQPYYNKGSFKLIWVQREPPTHESDTNTNPFTLQKLLFYRLKPAVSRCKTSPSTKHL